MKILKRNYVHWNLILFLISSLLYLQSVYSLSVGVSVFSVDGFRSFFINHYFIFGITLITSFMVFRVKKYSEIILILCLSVIVGKSFILLANSFNKLTLIFNFLYLVFAFYFFIAWELEVAFASFNPRFSSNDLEKESRFRLKASMSFLKDGTDKFDVLITSLDEHSCFVLLPEEKVININTSKPYLLELFYEGVHFVNSAYAVSSYDRGIGFVFENIPNTRLSWSELYKVCLERGIVS